MYEAQIYQFSKDELDSRIRRKRVGKFSTYNTKIYIIVTVL